MKRAIKHSAAFTLAIIGTLGGDFQAHAALVNDYSMTDDVWNAPIAPGHFLVDARGAYSSSTPSVLSLPTASVVYGLAPNAEIGLWGASTFSGLGTSESTAASPLLNPYLKVQLPWIAGSTTFGLVAGVQVPTQAGQEHNVALEGVASTQVSSTVILDLGLGIGQQFVASGTLGHANAALYYSLPWGPTLLSEVYADSLTNAPPNYGEHVGLLFPVEPYLTTDLSVAAIESAAGFGGWVPQLGVTWIY